MLRLQHITRWSDEKCREFLEAMRWPDGPVCPKCRAEEPYRVTRKTRTKNHVKKLFRCRNKECGKQLSTTVGTIFDDLKVPLQKWLKVTYLMCSSKKGINAHQVHRTIGVTYKTAWLMCRRIWEAKRDDSDELMSSGFEVDETYIGNRKKRGHPIVHERIKDEQEMGLNPKPLRRASLEGKTPLFATLDVVFE